MTQLCSLQEFDPPLKEGDVILICEPGIPVARAVITRNSFGELVAKGVIRPFTQIVKYSCHRWYKRDLPEDFKMEDWL